MHRQIVEFSKYNPSGNMTILVHSKHHPEEYASIANQLMATTHVCCEQVGFIESSDYTNGDQFHLVMSGMNLWECNDVIHTLFTRTSIA